MTQPNPDDFSRDDEPRKYRALFYVTGEVTVDIEADSADEAKARAERMTEEENFGLELDDVTKINIGHIYKTPPMYHVLRWGKVMRVSRLEPGDEPREPRPDGF